MGVVVALGCGISGYGPDGPLRDKKAYDMLVQAESGVVSVTGSADAPAKVGISIADISSASSPTASPAASAQLQLSQTSVNEELVPASG